jgi:hypothetical protein
MDTATAIFIIVATIATEKLLERFAKDIRRIWKVRKLNLQARK